MKYVITINSKSYEVEVEKGEARVLSVAAATENVTYIAPAPAPVAVAQEAAPVAAPVAAAPVAAPVAAPAVASKPAGGDTINSPMPGTIISIQKRVGDHVRSGDVVLILEAMKMENEIVAMSEGTITHILTSKGAVVSTGDPLITIG